MVNGSRVGIGVWERGLKKEVIVKFAVKCSLVLLVNPDGCPEGGGLDEYFCATFQIIRMIFK